MKPALLAILALLALSAPAVASVRFQRIDGVRSPGTSASAEYLAPLAKSIVGRARGWQVWAVERRLVPFLARVAKG